MATIRVITILSVAGSADVDPQQSSDVPLSALLEGFALETNTTSLSETKELRTSARKT